MNRDGQTFKTDTSMYLVIQELSAPWDELPRDAKWHLVVNLTTNAQIKVSEMYLTSLEDNGMRLT